MATVIVVRDIGSTLRSSGRIRSWTHSTVSVYGPFERDELPIATSILHTHYPAARLKRYQLQPLPTTNEES